MPRRPPVDPQGVYHVGSRGVYGMEMFSDPLEYEVFLRMYGRVAKKYSWRTTAWALMPNHFHFVIALTDGGLSDGMRELNGGYSRWRNAKYELTRQGHLVRHAFFGRQLNTTEELHVACVYVDLNPVRHRESCAPLAGDWCSHAATVGLAYPQAFHDPTFVLETLSEHPARARALYQRLVEDEHARRSNGPTPNDGVTRRD
jgi:REP element-mobilizing transposase RayT